MSDAISLATPDPRWAESYVVGRDEVLNLLPTPPLDVQRHVLFRGRLRADAVIWREDEALKLDRALGHADDREAYAKGKDGFIDSVVQAAGTKRVDGRWMLAPLLGGERKARPLGRAAFGTAHHCGTLSSLPH